MELDEDFSHDFGRNRAEGFGASDFAAQDETQLCRLVSSYPHA